MADRAVIGRLILVTLIFIGFYDLAFTLVRSFVDAIYKTTGSLKPGSFLGVYEGFLKTLLSWQAFVLTNTLPFIVLLVISLLTDALEAEWSS